MNPRDWTFLQWLGAVLVVNGALVGSLNEMTDLLGHVWATHVVSLCTIGSMIVGGLITMNGGIGSQARNIVAAGGRVEVGTQATQALATVAMDATAANVNPAPGAAAAVKQIAEAK